MGFSSGDGRRLGAHSSQTRCLLRLGESRHDTVMKAHIIAKYSFVFPIRIIRVLALAVSLLAGTFSSLATTYSWNQSPPATYNITTDWTPNGPPGSADTATVGRSEEHTSELQSLRHLVCRLLL